MPGYSTTASLTINTLADLRVAPTGDGQLALVVGINSVADGRGGFYRWTPGAVDVEDSIFWNVVTSTLDDSGRWYRVFQRARSLPGGMVLVMNGGVKTLYAPGVVDANGLAVVSLTMDGTATGSPVFQSIWISAGEAQVDTTSANDLIVGGRATLSADTRVLTYRFARGATTIVSVLGALIPGFRNAPAGTPVMIRVEGV